MEQLNNQLQVFNSDEFGQIEIFVDEKRKEWFPATDIATILGYVNPRDAISKHCKKDGIIAMSQNTTQGNSYNKKFINEGNLYRLITKSKLPSAEKFETWVFDIVLPSIRKHGAYMTEDTLEKALTSPDFLIQLATKLKEEQTARKIAEEKVKVREKEIEYKDNVITGFTDEISLAEKRQILNRVVRQGTDYKKRYGELYTQFNLLYHIDLNRRLESYQEKYHQLSRTERKEKGVKRIDSKMQYIDEVLNMIPELYSVAVKLYESDVDKLVNQLYELRN